MSAVLTNKTLAFTSATVYGRTNRWASPELLEDGSRPNFESDVWAFGCVCYEVFLSAPDVNNADAPRVPQVLTRLLPFQECSSDIQIVRKLLRGDLPGQPTGAKIDSIDEVDQKMWRLMKRCWSTEVNMRPTCREILQDIESDASIWQFRYALPKSLIQESRQFQHAMRKSSGIPINLNQVGQILERLSDSRSESPQSNISVRNSDRNSMGSSSPMMTNTTQQGSPLLHGEAPQPSSYFPAAPASDVPGTTMVKLRNKASSIVADGESTTSAGDTGPFSGADAAIMADAFRKMLRKPDFARDDSRDGINDDDEDGH